MTMRSSLSRARGLGSAKTGSQHWWAERMTALALFPMTLWIIYSIVAGVGADYIAFKDWVSQPGTLTILVIYFGTLFWHVALGLTVVVEDYVHDKTMEVILIIAVKFGCVFFGVFSIISILKVGVGG